MDRLAPAVSNPRRRRRYSAEFKAMVIKACDESGQSVAGVARRHDLNTNLLHKWRKQFKACSADDFIRLPAAIIPGNEPTHSTVSIALPGGIVVHWPMNDIAASVTWLKALMS